MSAEILIAEKQMLIYLADLCYLHDWDNNQPVPLNVGYIAAYLKAQRPGHEIELFKDPRALVSRIAERPPDVLALSHYDWNTNLNLPILEHAKRIRPDVVTVMGGPNFQADDPQWVVEFFRARPELEMYITGEGEWSFARLIELVERFGGVGKIPHDDYPSSFWSFDHRADRVIHNPSKPVARLDLATVPSPYLTGLLDSFLDDMRLAPIIETNRGCPYSCTFCCWGQATQSKVNQFPMETVLQEIRYTAARCKNPTGYCYIADGNFGIYKRDLEIARAIRKTVDECNFPKRVFIYFAKNTNDMVLNIAEVLKSVTSMSMSKQTLNQQVLENIKRKNIPIEQYDTLRRECETRGISTFCELIYGLAGESYESFVDGVIKTVRDGMKVVTMYPQGMIAGAESASPEYRKLHGLKTAYRIIPRYVSSYGDIHAMEYEEIVVETNAMSRNDYFRIRLFQFLVTLLSNGAFAEVQHFLRGNDLCYATLSKTIIEDEASWPTEFRRLLDEFSAACKTELLDADKVKHRFTSDDIKNVQIHQLALIPFFMAKLVSHRSILEDFRNYLLNVLDRRFACVNQTDMLATINLAFEKLACYDGPVRPKIVSHEYDFAAWRQAQNYEPLELFRLPKPIPYRYFLDSEVEAAFLRAKVITADTTQAVYRVRTNIIGPASGQVFCLRMAPVDTVDETIGTTELAYAAHRVHAETAVRH